LRLTHARLLEEHGASTALLRRRKAEISDLERREAETRQTVESLESDVRFLKEKVDRREHRAILAEREVGFLQALVVSVSSVRTATVIIQLSQASFTAEEATQDGAIIDEAKNQHVQQLEALLHEYKSEVSKLTKEIDALGGDSSSLGQGRSRQDLSADIEQERQSKLEMRKGAQALKAYRLLITSNGPQRLMQWKPSRNNILTRLKSLSSRFSNLEGKLELDDMSPLG
jgi:mitotic spindle assembly checkpoint protein MAD1